jgi:Skp family chaperone for outer membrane proteins
MFKIVTAGLAAAVLVAPSLAMAEPATAGDAGLGGPAVPGVCLLSQQAVFANAKVGVAAAARLKALAQQAQAGVDAERGGIEADAKALQAQKASLKPDQFDERQKALADRVQALQAHVALRSREIEATREKALARIAEEARPVVNKAYADHHCGLLVDRNAVLGGNMAGDLTTAVVQGLDAKVTTITFERETLPENAASTGQ